MCTTSHIRYLHHNLGEVEDFVHTLYHLYKPRDTTRGNMNTDPIK